MFLLTRKTDYALVAMTHLARRDGSLASAREISETSRIPLPVLMNILNTLARHGLVASARGVKGGYRLARAPEDITLADVIEAIEGSARLTVCASAESGEQGHRCGLEGVCVVRGPALRVHRRLRRFLQEVTLAELASAEDTNELEPCGAQWDAHGNEYDRGADEPRVQVWVRDGY